MNKQIRRNAKLIPVMIAGQKVFIDPKQIPQKDFKSCHGHDEASKTDVHSLGIKTIGDTTFIQDGDRMSAYKTADLRVAAKELLSESGFVVTFNGTSAAS